MLLRRAIPLFLLPFLALSCGQPEKNADWPALSDSAFEELILELGEKPGYFDTDNLISNEASYQQVVPRLLKMSGPGGVYLGVGPDQNFTYIAALRPSLAFIVDIRRDNLVQHLFYQEIFRRADSPAMFLSLLLGRPREEPLHELSGLRELMAEFRDLPPDKDYFASNLEEIWFSLRSRFPRVIRDQDQAGVAGISRAFFRYGLELKFRSHGRPPRHFYPSFERLILETDLEGRPHHYLQQGERFDLVRQMQIENRIVPLVGDLAGDKALRRLGNYLESKDLEVTAFYTSNVEFYLFRQRRFARFVSNVRSLPLRRDALFIRSHFGYWRQAHPETAPGYFVASLLQGIPQFLDAASKSPYRSYEDIVWRDYIPILENERPTVP